MDAPGTASSSLFGRIAIVFATAWESRGLVSALGLRPCEGRSGEYRDARGAVRVSVSGIGPVNARRSAEALLDGSPSLVFSAGFAGALKPGIRAGDLVLDSERSHPQAAEIIAESAAKELTPFHSGAFYQASRPLMTASEKAEAAARTGAIAVEMEGQSVYEACRGRGVAFCGLRAISDTADQTLPGLIQALDPSGRVGPRFWRSFCAHPAQWPSFFRLATSSRKAETALTGILRRLPGEAK